MQKAELTAVTDKMPCCGGSIKYLEGPRGGLATNIECFHCQQRWNTYIADNAIYFIDKIPPDLKRITPVKIAEIPPESEQGK